MSISYRKASAGPVFVPTRGTISYLDLGHDFEPLAQVSGHECVSTLYISAHRRRGRTLASAPLSAVASERPL